MRKFLLLFIVVLFSSCHLSRYVTRLNANITDHKIFPKTEISTGQNTFQFLEQPTEFTVVSEGVSMSLDERLQQTSTVSFLVIHKDTILFENYYKGYKPDSISNIFSASKSITSLLVGIAIDEGKIKSVNDPVVNYIPELKEGDPMYLKLTVEDLLEMRSGLKFKEAYLNPFAHVARLYYGKNQLKQFKNLKFEYEPGEVHDYQSISTAVLGMVVERATQMELGKYLEQKVWQPMGMEFDASWSVDDNKNRSTKAFCCLNTTARDLAKIGRLYLNNGNWNGTQIVSEDWILRSKTANMENDCYQYQWYSQSAENDKDKEGNAYTDSLSAVNAAIENKYQNFYVERVSNSSKEWQINYCSENFYAVGILGQILYLNPSEDIIMVRLGEKRKVSYGKIFTQIMAQIENKEKEVL
ncbi:serine hydrolase [Flammeovirga sp. EKP202]|uniref:serine hydrolase domain-containing protein n=1 Tax=Flammeovirga sp. EKP202 TaxID=2770592 RepID=UPI00165FDE2F|nr:serine hydrolase [Flammeovirga sp. EKP202]MBD0401505.1 serine hydrolase [Flammeovirga sp. EKP202]